MKSLLKSLVIAVSIAATAQIVHAQQLGDVKAGLEYADAVCAECHAVKKGERVSPHERAPAFELVANARGMSEMALRVWFQSPHPSMPNLMLKEKTSDDLIAYIMSLKQNRRSKSGL
jgi:mono/diheme cytochrome c family protein